MRQLNLFVGGMSCRRCVREVTARLRDVPGVVNVSADATRSVIHLSGTMQLRYPAHPGVTEINRLDRMMLDGRPCLGQPSILRSDGAGIIDEVGPGVDGRPPRARGVISSSMFDGERRREPRLRVRGPRLTAGWHPR